jgi:hypothetical protein
LLKQSLLIASLLLSGASSALADGSIVYVMRPSIPGKSVGVIKGNPFASVPSSPQQPGLGDSGEYDYVSRDFFSETSTPIKETTLRVRQNINESPEAILIRLNTQMSQAICGIQGKKIGTSGGLGLYDSNNIGGIRITATAPGKYAIVVECVYLDTAHNMSYRHVDRLVVTVPQLL